MNNTILNIVDKHSKELNFESNLENLIKTLNVKLEEVKNTQHNKSLIYFSDIYKKKSKINNKKETLIKSILNQTTKTKFDIEETKIPWTNGHDGHDMFDVISYDISYLLNTYEINFKIDVAEKYSIIHATVSIDNVLVYTLVDNDGELGYYQQDGKRGVISYDDEQAKKFYYQFDLNKNYQTVKDFYTDFITILFSSISNEISHEFDEICVDL